MKLIFLALLCICSALADNFEIQTEFLDVPADTGSWKFLGNESDAERGGRISFGLTATSTQFPWVAELEINTNSGGALCSGSLISNQWILSARHCFTG